MEEQCTVYKAVVSENRTLISAETPIVYVDDQQQSHVGIFRQGLKMETTQQEVVEIERIKFCLDDNEQPILGSFQCPKVRKTGEIALISPDQVVDQLCLIHDCANGKCAFKESEITIMVEREKVTRVKFTYVHDREHNFYLINKFYLGESLKYFNFA